MGVRINRLQAGDSWSFVTAAADYAASDGWTLTLYLVPRFSSPAQTPIAIASFPDTDDPSLHRFEASAVATAGYKPGRYGYFTRAAKGAEKYTLDATQFGGEVSIDPDPSTLAQGFDARSQAQKALDDARQALADAQARAANAGTAGSASGGVVEYSIADRKMRYGSPQEAVASLLAAISYWTIEVRREARAHALAQGLNDPGKVYVRMQRG